MKIEYNDNYSDGAMYRCTSKNFRIRMSIRLDSWVSQAKISLRTFIEQQLNLQEYQKKHQEIILNVFVKLQKRNIVLIFYKNHLEIVHFKLMKDNFLKQNTIYELD